VSGSFFQYPSFNPLVFIGMEVLLPTFSKYQETLYPYLSLRHFRQESDPVCFPQIHAVQQITSNLFK
ncbi:hypothetical protein LI271_17210, partial [Lachnospiraceae bacterium 210521-DFI.5.20]|nr:hypothetical protein [Lachnospiraceae bacterium 210521-DFI.5.20]